MVEKDDGGKGKQEKSVEQEWRELHTARDILQKAGQKRENNSSDDTAGGRTRKREDTKERERSWETARKKFARERMEGRDNCGRAAQE